MISTVAWVPRGAMRRVPLKQELTAEELAGVAMKAAGEMASLKAKKAAFKVGDAAEEEEEEVAKPRTAEEIMSDPAFASLRDVVLPASLLKDDEQEAGDDDMDGEGGEQVTGGGAASGADAYPQAIDDEDDDSNDEDLEARVSDAFLMVGNTEDDHSTLEVYCYNSEDGSLYVHHDITLPAFPLCTAWMDYAGAAAANAMIQQTGAAGVTADTFVGNYVAVGTFKNDIEIWNVDVLDPLEPSLILKGTKAARPGSKKKATAVAGAGAASATAGHSDAVMGLAWNKTARQLLASSSADTTCKLWDMNTASVLHTFSHHRGKVSSVAWHPVEASILATASYDRTLSTLDAREGSASRVGRYALPADPECMLWNMHSPAQLIASTEDGSVTAYDVRSPDRPLWTVKAHTGAASGVSLSSLAPGMMATCGIDKCVKVWDIASPSGTAPVCIASKGMSIGQIFTVSFFAQSPFLLAAGGSKGMVAVWDVASDAGEVTPAAAAAAAREGVAATSEHSLTAQRFVSRIPADPSTIPGFGLRPRADGQPLA